MKFWRSASGRKNARRAGHALNIGIGKSKWRRENSPRAVTRVLVIGVFFVLVGGLLLLGVRQSMAFLTENPQYAITAIEIPAPAFLTSDEVAALSGARLGDNLLRLPIRDIRKKLLEHPNIREASVTRLLPSTLRIEIKEREPMAQISIGKNYLVDEEGAVLSWNQKFAETPVPLVDGLDMKSKMADNKVQSEALRDALRILKIYQGALILTRMEIQKVKLDQEDGHLFWTDKGVCLKMAAGMNAQEIQEKLHQLLAVWDDLQKKGVAAETIDLRFTDVVVTPKEKKEKKAK